MKMRAFRVALATIALPTVATAQSGLIITSPAAFPAPALGMWMLVALSLGLAGGAMWMLRRAKLGALAQVAVTLLVCTVVGVAYATRPNTIIVSGDECNRTTEHPFDPDAQVSGTLFNACTNAIRVVGIEVDCNDNESVGGGGLATTPTCKTGMVLQSEDSCILPNFCSFG